MVFVTSEFTMKFYCHSTTVNNKIKVSIQFQYQSPGNVYAGSLSHSRDLIGHVNVVNVFKPVEKRPIILSRQFVVTVSLTLNNNIYCFYFYFSIKDIVV